jgi:feruloyl esterase
VAECVPDQWIAWITGPAPALLAKDHVPDLTFAFGTQIYKYLIFNQPDWDYSTYDFSNYEREGRLAASFLNATNSDLTAFKARQGKLIIWHGWADPALPAQGTIDYFRQVQAHDSEAGDYCRLFLVPGVEHCRGGPGTDQFDLLGSVIAWREHGIAPDQVVASGRIPTGGTRTRLLCPHPQVARYNGSGDANQAASFTCAEPRR